MSDTGHPPAPERRRLPSIFDGFPPGTPLSLDALELAMGRDTERRCLAALDRALARLAAPALPSLPTPRAQGGPLEPPI